jgi:uncharacterized membrane protein
MSTRVATVSALVSTLVAVGPQPGPVREAPVVHAHQRAQQSTIASPGRFGQGNKGLVSTGIATLSTLPSLPKGGPSEAVAVDETGSVIVGYSWDAKGLLHGVKWTQQPNGSWTIGSLPWPAGATRTIARGVSNQSDAAGNDDYLLSSASRAVLWPATGGVALLGCSDDIGPATVHAISADRQVVVGQEHLIQDGVFKGSTASLWQPGSCRTDLPPLVSGGSATAMAVNSDATVVGGAAAPTSSPNSASVPVRWRSVAGQWQIEQLDNRPGPVRGANGLGDLAGGVTVPLGAGCVLADGCSRAVIWYVGGGSRELGTLGGAHSWARDINASGEVVGGSTSPHVGNTAFFWSQSIGMYQLPIKGSWAAANAVSDVRSDGTRLVVGMSSQGTAIAWVVRN